MRWRRVAPAVLVMCVVVLVAAGATFGADPSPTPIVAVDPRSGPMPKMTGNPTVVAILVILLGVITAAATAFVVRILPPGRRGA